MMHREVEEIRNVLCSMRQGLGCHVCKKVCSNPWTMRCGHSFCQECIEKERDCPRCLFHAITRRSKKTNYELEKIILQFKKLEEAVKADTHIESSKNLFVRSFQVNSEMQGPFKGSRRDKDDSFRQRKIKTPPARINTDELNSSSETEYFQKFRKCLRKQHIVSVEEDEQEESPEEEHNFNSQSESLSHNSNDLDSRDDLDEEEVEDEQQDKEIDEEEKNQSQRSDEIQETEDQDEVQEEMGQILNVREESLSSSNASSDKIEPDKISPKVDKIICPTFEDFLNSELHRDETDIIIIENPEGSTLKFSNKSNKNIHFVDETEIVTNSNTASKSLEETFLLELNSRVALRKSKKPSVSSNLIQFSPSGEIFESRQSTQFTKAVPLIDFDSRDGLNEEEVEDEQQDEESDEEEKDQSQCFDEIQETEDQSQSSDELKETEDQDEDQEGMGQILNVQEESLSSSNASSEKIEPNKISPEMDKIICPTVEDFLDSELHRDEAGIISIENTEGLPSKLSNKGNKSNQFVDETEIVSDSNTASKSLEESFPLELNSRVALRKSKKSSVSSNLIQFFPSGEIFESRQSIQSTKTVPLKDLDSRNGLDEEEVEDEQLNEESDEEEKDQSRNSDQVQETEDQSQSSDEVHETEDQDEDQEGMGQILKFQEESLSSSNASSEKIELNKISPEMDKIICPTVEDFLNSELHKDKAGIISIENTEGSTSKPSNESNKSNQFVDETEIIPDSNTVSKSLEESFPLELSSRVVLRERKKPSVSSNLIQFSPSGDIFESRQSTQSTKTVPLIDKSQPLSVELPAGSKSVSGREKLEDSNFRRKSKNVPFIKAGRLCKAKKKIPFYKLGKLSRGYNLLDKDVTILSPSELKTNMSTNGPVIRTLFNFGFKRTRGDLGPGTPEIERRPIEIQNSEKLTEEELAPHRPSKKQKLVPESLEVYIDSNQQNINHDNDSFSENGTAELLSPYLRRKNLAKVPEVNSARKRKSRVSNSEKTTEILNIKQLKQKEMENQKKRKSQISDSEKTTERLNLERLNQKEEEYQAASKKLRILGYYPTSGLDSNKENEREISNVIESQLMSCKDQTTQILSQRFVNRIENSSLKEIEKMRVSEEDTVDICKNFQIDKFSVKDYQSQDEGTSNVSEERGVAAEEERLRIDEAENFVVEEALDEGRYFIVLPDGSKIPKRLSHITKKCINQPGGRTNDDSREIINISTDDDQDYSELPVEEEASSSIDMDTSKLKKIFGMKKSLTKATTCKEAIQRWEEANQKEAGEATDVFLGFQWPPIDRMDNSLAALTSVEKLSLSTNMIEKITGISSLKNLKILSLGRNYIKTFSGLEAVGEHLEELWISYNLIEKLKGVNALKALKVLYMSNNLVKDWNEFNRLQELPHLQDLLFTNNPVSESVDQEVWRVQVTRRLPALKKLDSIPIVHLTTGDE